MIACHSLISRTAPFPAPRQPVRSPLVLSRVHWVRSELVAEVKYLTWTEDNLLRQVVYEGLREDKPAAEVRRSAPHPKPMESTRPAPRSKRPRSG
jgi:ATP-dependent DNA ligase